MLDGQHMSHPQFDSVGERFGADASPLRGSQGCFSVPGATAVGRCARHTKTSLAAPQALRKLGSEVRQRYPILKTGRKIFSTAKRGKIGGMTHGCVAQSIKEVGPPLKGLGLR